MSRSASANSTVLPDSKHTVSTLTLLEEMLQVPSSWIQMPDSLVVNASSMISAAPAGLEASILSASSDAHAKPQDDPNYKMRYKKPGSYDYHMHTEWGAP